MEMKQILVILVILAIIYAVKIYQPQIFSTGDNFLTNMFSKLFQGVSGFVKTQISNTPPVVNGTTEG